ncbi:MAG: hypothetical protein AB8G96_05280 [Phycisphaerales bacterium]
MPPRGRRSIYALDGLRVAVAFGYVLATIAGLLVILEHSAGMFIFGVQATLPLACLYCVLTYWLMSRVSAPIHAEIARIYRAACPTVCRKCAYDAGHRCTRNCPECGTDLPAPATGPVDHASPGPHTEPRTAEERGDRGDRD